MNPPEIINTHNLTWNANHDCVFTATITNNIVTDLHFCEPPAKVGDEQTCIRSTNEHFLRQTMQNLIELFNYIDNQRAKTGTFKTDEQ